MNRAGACIECGSNNTEMFRGDDDHFRKRCNDCGYTGGPYVSDELRNDQGGQMSLSDQSWEK